MVQKIDFTAQQTGADGLSKWAVFLPAISGFHAHVVGRQKNDPTYIPQTRLPAGVPSVESLDWLNSQAALFPYRWSLYSAGHANLDLTKDAPSEDMIRKRETNSFLIADSGGFQILKGMWEGDWRAGSGCPRAQKKRETVLTWLDTVADYSIILDIPTGVLSNKRGMENSKITTYAEAVAATEYNNEYFMDNRQGVKNGGGKFLNVLQGTNHAESDYWYSLMKKYCDPGQYPNHFDGWAFGGQNKCDVHLTLRRLVDLRHDGLLQEGIHDWIHFLGTSRLDWSLMLTDIQRALRENVNPQLTLSFDAASPFLTAANGAIYYDYPQEHLGRWTFKTDKCIDDRKFHADTRKFSDAMVAEGYVSAFVDSIVTDNCTLSDICTYAPGDVNRLGNVSRTSWDGLSYSLIMAHNVYSHIAAVQQANEKYESGGIWPDAMWNARGDHAKFRDIVDEVFATDDRDKSLKLIDKYSRYWSTFMGSGGLSGNKTTNSSTLFSTLFDFDEPVSQEAEINEDDEELNDALDQLDHDLGE